MKDYIKQIDLNLSKYTPSFTIEVLNEVNSYVTTPPKVSGYFKFINIRYMKRVKHIKKLCIDYINTYIDGCLNLAKNMSDAQLSKAQDSLSNDINLEAAGVNQNQQLVDAKHSVLFLTADKALKDKLNLIITKINLRAEKSEVLTEWANLMVLQSKIQANDIIYKKTNELIKDISIKKQQQEKMEKEIKERGHKINELEKMLKDKQKSLATMIKHFGEAPQWFKNIDMTIDKLVSYTRITEKDLTKKNNKSDKLDNGKVNSMRKSFYADAGYEKYANNFVIDLSTYNKLTPEQWHWLYACMAVANTSKDGKFTASPVDVCIAMANTKSAMDLLQKSGHTETIDGISMDDYEIKKFTKSKACNTAFKELVTDKDPKFDIHLVFIFTRLFSKDKCVLQNDSEETNESKRRVMTACQFITEDMIQNTISLEAASDAMLDLLSDCDDGCLYVGNIPGIDEVSYAMLYSRDHWGFFIEQGNLEQALESGHPQRPKLIQFDNRKTLEIINIIFDTINKDMVSDIDWIN